MKLRSKRTFVLLGVLAVAIFAAVGAYAYFTASGSGSGNASVGSASNIQLSSDAVSGLFPGGADVPVTVHVHNPGSGNQYVNQISGSVADNAGCLGAWFEVDSVSYGQDVSAGSNGPDAPTAVRMLDSGTNQDVCQGKTMTIN